MLARLAAVVFMCSPALVLAQAGKTAAPKIPAAAVGTWEGKSVNAADNKVITTFTTVISADGKVTQTLAGRPAQEAKVIAAGGDSLVVEIGPYNSILKPGVKATTRSVTHYKGDASTGTFEAKYSDGSTVKGTMSGSRKK